MRNTRITSVTVREMYGNNFEAFDKLFGYISCQESGAEKMSKSSVLDKLQIDKTVVHFCEEYDDFY